MLGVVVKAAIRDGCCFYRRVGAPEAIAMPVSSDFSSDLGAACRDVTAVRNKGYFN